MLFSNQESQNELMALTVKDLMTANVFGVEADLPMSELPKLFFEYSIRHFPVVDKQGKLFGILSHRDYLAAMPSCFEELNTAQTAEKIVNYSVKDLARKEVITVGPETLLIDAAGIMREKRIGSLVVMEGEEIVGILYESDFMKLALGRTV